MNYFFGREMLMPKSYIKKRMTEKFDLHTFFVSFNAYYHIIQKKIKNKFHKNKIVSF